MSLPIESFEPTAPARQQETPLSSHVDAIFSNRWMIIGITLLALLGAVIYVMMTPSVYQADIIVQVEEEQPNGQARSLLGDVSAIFDTKTETSGEMEVLRSRMVVGPAVDKFLLYIHARPNYFPVVGAWLAQRHELSLSWRPARAATPGAARPFPCRSWMCPMNGWASRCG